MTYTSMMVHMDLEHSNTARLRVAARLSAQFEAKLIGTAALQPVPPAYAEGIIAPELIAQDRARTKEKMAEVERELRGAMLERGNDVEWRQAFEPPARFVARQSRAADLIIIGGSHGEIAPDPYRVLDPGDLVMVAGRPVLVVPDAVEELRAEHIVVAWKDTREARRAVADAMPLLKRAAKVLVFEVREATVPEGASGSADDVVSLLQRHEVRATAVSHGRHDAVFPQLVDLARYEEADLIVAGAYGHSRLRELILGGVTRDLMVKSPICSLMSH